VFRSNEGPGLSRFFGGVRGFVCAPLWRQSCVNGASSVAEDVGANVLRNAEGCEQGVRRMPQLVELHSDLHRRGPKDHAARGASTPIRIRVLLHVLLATSAATPTRVNVALDDPAFASAERSFCSSLMAGLCVHRPCSERGTAPGKSPAHARRTARALSESEATAPRSSSSCPHRENGSRGSCGPRHSRPPSVHRRARPCACRVTWSFVKPIYHPASARTLRRRA
jgi:hypothetical protein